MAYRTHNCNQLTFDQLNQTVSLAGWVDTIRDHGGVIFIDLRDERDPGGVPRRRAAEGRS